MAYLRLHDVQPNKVKLGDYIGRSNEESWEMLVSNTDKRVHLYNAYYMYLKEHPFDFRNAVNKGVRPLLRFLNESNYAIGLASAGPYDELQRVLHQCDIYQYFDVVLSGEMCRNNKPAPDVYLKMLQQINVHKNDALVIEDSENGIHAAKAAGIETWAVKHNDYYMNQNEADRIVNDMHQVMVNLEIDQGSAVSY
jgi:HAD superfamily hydrolase (TIGR01509 family)